LVLWVNPHTSLKLPGRTAKSQGRTCTGKSLGIHGMRTLPLLSLSAPTRIRGSGLRYFGFESSWTRSSIVAGR